MVDIIFRQLPLVQGTGGGQRWASALPMSAGRTCWPRHSFGEGLTGGDIGSKLTEAVAYRRSTSPEKSNLGPTSSILRRRRTAMTIPIGGPGIYSRLKSGSRRCTRRSRITCVILRLAGAISTDCGDLQLPGVDIAGLTPDYAGIRPNLSPPGSGFTDFHISYDPATRPGLIGLCGFNSPGLTSSLAVGEAVEQMCRRDVWGTGSGRAGRRVSEVGGQALDGWA